MRCRCRRRWRPFPTPPTPLGPTLLPPSRAAVNAAASRVRGAATGASGARQPRTIGSRKLGATRPTQTPKAVDHHHHEAAQEASFKRERREAAEDRRERMATAASATRAAGLGVWRTRDQNRAVDSSTSSLDSTTIALLVEEGRLGPPATPPHTPRAKQPVTPPPQSHTPLAPHALPMPSTPAPPSPTWPTPLVPTPLPPLQRQERAARGSRGP